MNNFYHLCSKNKKISSHFISYFKPLGLVLALGFTPFFVLPITAIAQAVENQAAEIKTYNITAGPLSSVLTRFAETSGSFVAGSSHLAAGKTSEGVQGSYTVDQALAQILNGTGLVAEKQTSGGYALVDPTNDSNVMTLDSVRVGGEGLTESAYGPVDGYVATRSGTGTKIDTPILEIPRSISVVTAVQMTNQDMETISEALRYTSGVMTEARGLDKTRPFIGIRGFYHRDAALVFRDGMLGSPFDSPLHADIDLYGLERMEVLRGPASVLYGQGAPGGMVVTVTKRPKEYFFAEMEGFFGSFRQKGGKFDVSGPLDDEKEHLFRVTGLFAGGDSQIDTLEDNKTFIASSYTWKPNNNTSLTLLGHYQEIDAFESASLPAVVVGVLPNPNGNVPNNRFGGEPGHQFNDSEESSIGYIFEHKFGENISLKHSLRREDGEVYMEGSNLAGFLSGLSGSDGLRPDNRTVDRFGFTNSDQLDSTSIDTNLKFHVNSKTLEQTILLGVDYRTSRSQFSGTCCVSISSIDIYEPVYTGFTVGPIGYSNDNEMNQVGLYLQDQIKFDEHWIVNLGLRHDQADAKSKDDFTSDISKSDDKASTFQVGGVYLFDNGIAPYVSYSESFQPQGGTDFEGGSFDPTTGEQLELGVKFQPKNSDTLVTASIYQITRQNVITPDLFNIGFDVQTGEVQSQGLETEIKTKAMESIDLIASYSYTEVEVTESNASNKGAQLIQIPEHQASIWADYHFFDDMSGLVTSAGVRYVGSFPGDEENTFDVDSRTLLDMAIRYEFEEGKGLHFRFNISNLLDEYYVTSCNDSRKCYLGPGRVAKFSMGYRW